MITQAVYPPVHEPGIRRQDVAALIEHAYRWTRAAAVVVPPVAQQAAPALTVAAQLYAAQQYPTALEQLSRVMWVLHQARQGYPALPEL